MVALFKILPLLFPVTLASISPGGSPTSRDKKPTPVRPFTVAAFQSPHPPGNGSISGLTLRAQGGSFFLNPQPCPVKGCPLSILWVDINGEAWLDPKNPQQVFMDTKTGILSYSTNGFPDGALKTNFLHLGAGTEVAVPIEGAPGFYNAGPGTFQWLGSENDYWFACPRPGHGYQVMKYVGGTENWNLCVSGVKLVALDYTG